MLPFLLLKHFKKGAIHDFQWVRLLLLLWLCSTDIKYIWTISLQLGVPHKTSFKSQTEMEFSTYLMLLWLQNTVFNYLQITTKDHHQNSGQRGFWKLAEFTFHLTNHPKHNSFPDLPNRQEVKNPSTRFWAEESFFPTAVKVGPSFLILCHVCK